MKSAKTGCTHSIDDLCEAAGFTRQAHYAYIKRRRCDEHLYRHVFDVVTQIRQKHPIMGLRKMWYYTKPDWIGRDQFISIGVDIGLEVPKPKNYQRTTFSSRSNLFGNLTTNLEIMDINTVWVSDITYFYAHDTFYYITIIEDVYSRRIVGWIAARTLEAEACCTALRRAIKARSGHNLSGLIHHSDKGVQYTSDAYLKILKDHKMDISLCDCVYENTHIERLNGILKNEYLNQFKINDFNELTNKLKEAVYLYNNERPHFSLDYQTPVEFEARLTEIPVNDRRPLIIWSDPTINRRSFQYLLFN
jgi:putative transposase